MKKLILIALVLLMSACASHKQHSERRIERCDTFRAVISDQLTMHLDDIVIIPRDSLRPVVTAKRGELRRITTADIQTETCINVEEIADNETSAPVAGGKSRKLRYIAIILLMAAISLVIIRKLYMR